MITINGLTFTHKASQQAVLAEVDLEIRENECLTIIGQSGCGKSTLLRLMAGLLQADQGTILRNQAALQASDVAYMPQKETLLPWKTVKQNILLAQLFNQQIQFSEAELDQWLAQAGLLAYKNQYPQTLSGGMKQSVGFLRTLLTQRPILLLDEPFGALDSLTKSKMQEWLIERWQQEQKTLVLVSHDLEEALLLSDRIAVMTSKGLEIHEVNIPRPRHTSQRFTPEFIRQRAELERILNHEES